MYNTSIIMIFAISVANPRGTPAPDPSYRPGVHTHTSSPGSANGNTVKEGTSEKSTLKSTIAKNAEFECAFLLTK